MRRLPTLPFTPERPFLLRQLPGLMCASTSSSDELLVALHGGTADHRAARATSGKTPDHETQTSLCVVEENTLDSFASMLNAAL